MYVRNSKQAPNHGLKLEKVHRVIKFNYEQWLKTYIILNSKKNILQANEQSSIW